MTTGNKSQGTNFLSCFCACNFFFFFFCFLRAFIAAEKPKEVTYVDVDVLCKKNMGAGPNTEVWLTLEFTASFC